MNEIWLVYHTTDHAEIHGDIVSYAVSENDADELIKKYEKICSEDPKINVYEGVVNSCIHDQRKHLSSKQWEENFEAHEKYLQSIPFEERMKYQYRKNAKFLKIKVEKGQTHE